MPAYYLTRTTARPDFNVSPFIDKPGDAAVKKDTRIYDFYALLSSDAAVKKVASVGFYCIKIFVDWLKSALLLSSLYFNNHFASPKETEKTQTAQEADTEIKRLGDALLVLKQKRLEDNLLLQTRELEAVIIEKQQLLESSSNLPVEYAGWGEVNAEWERLCFLEDEIKLEIEQTKKDIEALQKEIIQEEESSEITTTPAEPVSEAAAAAAEEEEEEEVVVSFQSELTPISAEPAPEEVEEVVSFTPTPEEAAFGLDESTSEIDESVAEKVLTPQTLEFTPGIFGPIRLEIEEQSKIGQEIDLVQAFIKVMATEKQLKKAINSVEIDKNEIRNLRKKSSDLYDKFMSLSLMQAEGESKDPQELSKQIESIDYQIKTISKMIQLLDSGKVHEFKVLKFISDLPEHVRLQYLVPLRKQLQQ